MTEREALLWHFLELLFVLNGTPDELSATSRLLGWYGPMYRLRGEWAAYQGNHFERAA